VNGSLRNPIVAAQFAEPGQGQYLPSGWRDLSLRASAVGNYRLTMEGFFLNGLGRGNICLTMAGSFLNGYGRGNICLTMEGSFLNGYGRGNICLTTSGSFKFYSLMVFLGLLARICFAEK
jgi:hypothetical protein